MGATIHDILVRVLGENRDAVGSINEVQRKISETGTMTAKPEIDLKGITRSLADVALMKRELDSLDASRFTPEVRLRIDRARTDLATMTREMTVFRNQLLAVRNQKGPLDPAALAKSEQGLRGFATRLEQVHRSIFDIDKSGGLKFKVDTTGEGIAQFVDHLRNAMERGLRRVPWIGGLLGGTVDLGASLATVVTKAIGPAFDAFTGIVSKIPVVGATAAEGLTSFAGAVGPLVTTLATAGPAVLALVVAVALLGSVIATAIGVIGALVASLASAVAGAGLLAGALLAALGPAVLLVFGAITQLVQAFQQLDQQGNKSTQTIQRVQGAQAGVRSATENVASAQQNLREQTTAAWQAWHDSIQTVKDDLLAVQHAELGIQDAKLRFDEAKQALRDFLATANAPQLFKKIADVAFNQAQVPGILAGSGTNLSADDELKLRRLVLDIKDAKLGEADASNTLVKANEKLSTDRRTEADFAQRGILAFRGYRDAVNQARRATEALGRARAALAKAHDVPPSMTDISPQALKAASALLAVWNKLKGVFSPVFGHVMDGIVSGLESLARTIESRSMLGALDTLGRVIGSVFAKLGRVFADPHWQAFFTMLAQSASQLVGPLTSLFVSVLTVVSNLITDAMPTLIRDVRSFAREVRAWEQHHGGAKKLWSTVQDLIGSFNVWLTILKGLGLILLAFLRGGKRDGDTFARSLGQMLVSWGKFLNTGAGQRAIHTFFHNAIGDARTLYGVFVWVGRAINFVVVLIRDYLIPMLKTVAVPFQILGDLVKLAQGKGGGGDLLSKITGFGGSFLSNFLPGGQLGPKLVKRAGSSLAKHAADIADPFHFFHRLGGIATAPTPGVFGEAGPEALIPLNGSTFAQLGAAIAAAMGGHGGGTHIDRVILPPAPAGAVPDARYQASQFAHHLAAMGH